MGARLGVLFLHSQVGFGADSAIHAHIARELDRERFDVHVACAAGEPGSKSVSLERFEKLPDTRLRPTQFLPGLRRKSVAELAQSLGAAARAPLEFRALADYVRAHDIRVLHATDRPRDSTYALALAKVTRAKSIVHVHVKWSEEYSAPAKWAVRHADAVFAISRYVEDTVVGMGTPRERVHTVPNAIDPGVWDPATDGAPLRRELGIAEDALVLASVSRLFSWKGQRELVKALPAVRAQFPNVHLLIVGADERHVHGGSFTAELKELAAELGVTGNVTFTGQRSDIPRVMAACDVFALPSYEEPFGLVFLEAMAMKKPVAAVNNGGTPEVVEHGLSGLLSEPWDVAGLAENLCTLLGDRALRARLGEHGRARVVAYFNAERMAADAGRAYERVLGV